MGVRNFQDAIHETVMTDAPGVSAGVLANTAARTANVTALNLAIVNAVIQNRTIKWPPGRFEIYGPILMNIDGLRWEASPQTVIVQFQLNVPVVHVGHPYGSANASRSRVVMKGGELRYYGVATSGGNALELGQVWMSLFEDLDIGDVNASYAGSRSTGGSVPYAGILFDPSAGTLPSFSNEFRGIRIKHVGWRHLSMMRDANGGDGAHTQNQFTNIYLSNGSGYGIGTNIGQLAPGGGMVMMSGHGQCEFNGLNMEWCACEQAIFANNSTCLDFSAINLEGVELTRATLARAGFVVLYNSEATFKSFNGHDLYSRYANNNDGTGIFSLGPGSRLTLDNFSVWGTTRTGNIMSLISSFGTGSQDDVIVNLGFGSFRNNGVDRIDNYLFTTAGQSLYGRLSQFNNETFAGLTDGNITLYTKQTAKRRMMTPSAARTIILSDKLGASEPIVSPQGVCWEIMNGHATNVITIKDADGTTTVATIAGFSSAKFMWNGYNWLKATI